ncbi:polysaccharide pyruvyl transferase family protein [Vibrio breoganii]
MHKYKKLYGYHRQSNKNATSDSPIFLYEPSISTLNLGDGIITESCRKHLRDLYTTEAFINCSSHLPQSSVSWTRAWSCKSSFVCGSNLLCSDMFMGRAWNISFLDSLVLPKANLLGVGWNNYQSKASTYTKYLYKNILSNTFIHSVRDKYTENKLKEIGINNVINTGCPTMWDLNESHCDAIPNIKSNEVVFTLTDYRVAEEEDMQLILALLEGYNTVYFWPQGSNDLSYFRKLQTKLGAVTNKINILPQSLSYYSNLLERRNIDFVGTRLHAGVKALQFKRRSLIIGVDNRATEKKKDFNLPVIERYKSKDDYLDSFNQKFNTEIQINDEAIKKWKEQFI